MREAVKNWLAQSREKLAAAALSAADLDHLESLLAVSEMGAARSDAAPRTNEFDQPIGFALPTWTPPQAPPKKVLQGHYCRVEPLDIASHLEDLYAAISLDKEGRSWTYLTYGPFSSIEDYRQWITATSCPRKETALAQNSCHRSLQTAT